MTDLGWPELLIVAVIAMMLFGTKKMPDVARSIGRSMRIVKAELGGLRDDEPAPTPAASMAPDAPAPAASAAPAPVASTAPAPVASTAPAPVASTTPAPVASAGPDPAAAPAPARPADPPIR